MGPSSNFPAKTPSSGFIRGLVQRIRLVFRLMADKRVFPLLKLIPIGTLLYLIIPDIPGPIDDAAVIGVGMTIFVELCPQYVVDEHMRKLGLRAEGGMPSSGSAPRTPANEDVLEGEFKDVDPSRGKTGDGQER